MNIKTQSRPVTKLSPAQVKALKALDRRPHFKIYNQFRHHRGQTFTIATGNALKRYGFARHCLIDTPNSTKVKNMPGIEITKDGRRALNQPSELY